MTRLFLLSLFCALLSAPAMAQDGTAAARLELARKMHEIWPVRTRIETAIQSVSENFPPEKQAEIKAAMRRSIQFDRIEQDSIKAMAETFDEEELKAMIEFYGSDVGRSISAKTADYESALTPAMTQMMDKAMMDLRTGQK